MKLFKNFSLEDLLIKIFVPDAEQPKAIDPFDMYLKKNNEEKKDQNEYKNDKKSG